MRINLTVISRSSVILTKTGFKTTEVDEIPEEWMLGQLGDKGVSEIVMGQSPPSSSYNTSGEGLPFLQGNADFGTLYPTPRVYCTKPLRLSEIGDILISVRAPVGELNISAFKCIIGRGLAAVRNVQGNTDGKYMYYYLKNSLDRLKSSSTGSTFKAVGKDTLMSFRIALPPLPEQQKIAEILSTADDAIQKVNEQITMTEQLKKGLMQQLLTKGIGHSKFKETEVGEIPEEWEVARLREMFNIVTGTTPSTKVEDYWNGGTIEWLTPKDLSYVDHSLILPRSERKITEKALKDNTLHLLPEKSILISTRAPVGYVAINDTEITFNQGCKGLVPLKREKSSPYFYAYYLESKTELLNSISGGSTFKELSKEGLENVKVPLPALLEQQKIAEILSTTDNKLNLLNKKKEKLEALKKGLMEDLLTGKTRVKV